MKLEQLKTIPKEIVEKNKELIQRFLDEYMHTQSSIYYAFNKKKGTRYILNDLILNCTNAQDGQVMVLYFGGGCWYARELSEFMEKFSPRIEHET